jgi:hypothetical protein
MKKLLLPAALALIAPQIQAGDDVIAFSNRTGVGVLRSSGNLYRPAPKGGSAANLTPSERYKAKLYRPTQYFYMKDNIVSYRYSSEELSRVGNEYDNGYHGPHAAVFVPTQHQLAPHGRMRSYASVDKRPQPGVAMVAKTTTKVTTRNVMAAPTTTLQVAGAN